MPVSKIKKICVVTTSRADYGLLYWTLKKIDSEKNFELQLIVSGTHLVKGQGNTVDFIIKDGFKPTKCIEIVQPGDNHVAVGKTSGIAVQKFTEAFAQLKPDAILLLGDRYEILAAAFAASVCVIPIVHFHGGEISEGANDDMFRHAITKLSSLHFVSTQSYKNRVIQMGEQPKRVFVSGALGIENIKKLKLLSRKELEKKLGIEFKSRIFLITFHPATMENVSPKQQIDNLLTLLNNYNDVTFIITKANADAHGNVINSAIEKFSKKNRNCYTTASLGQLNYLSVMAICDVVIGNSSSGIIEAPSFGKPVVNIGTRQNGRIKAASNIDCSTEIKSISKAIDKALLWKKKSKKVNNPYEKGSPSELIIKKLKKTKFNKLLPKSFYDIRLR